MKTNQFKISDAKSSVVGLLLMFFCVTGFTQNPAFQLSSTTGGFVAPSMTAAQRTAISSPVTGSLVYQTDAPVGYYYYNGTAWVQLLAGSNSAVTSISAGSTGLTPNTATTGAVTLAGTLGVANGGTGQTSYINGELLIGNTTGNTLTKATLTAGTGISITNGNGSITIANSGITSEVDGVIGNEVTDATASGGLTRSGSGTSGAPYTLGIASSGVTSTMISDGTIATADLANANVTYAKIQNVAASRLLGNPTGSSAPPSEISLGTGLSFSGTTLNSTGGTVTSVSGTSPITVTNGTTTPAISLGTVGVTNGGTGTISQFTQGSVVFAGASGVYTQDANFFWDNTNKRLGLGTNLPAFSIDAIGTIRAGSSTGKISMGNDNINGNITNSAGSFLFFTPASSNYVWHVNNAEQMRLTSSGNLCMGTTTERAKLTIEGTGPNQTMAAYYAYINTGPCCGIGAGQVVPYSLYTSGRVWVTGELDITSDVRTKNILGISDPKADLAMVNSLEVVDYKYKDEVAKGSHTIKGFKAQQVKEVFPMAVTENTDVIPNIYAVAQRFDIENGTLTVNLKEPADVKAGDKIKLIGDWGSEVFTVSKATVSSFSIDNFAYKPDFIFVYGTEKNDVLNLDYNKIFSAGISAIQELTRKVKILEQQNLALQSSKTNNTDFEKMKADIEYLKEALLKAEK